MAKHKKPWEAKVFASKLGQKLRSDRKPMVNSSWLLSILFSIFFLIMVVMLFIIFYTSNGGSNKETARKGFYDSKAPVTQAEKTPVETEENSADDDSEDKQSDRKTGQTIEVLAGEGAASIASRAGISLDRLYALNPDKMVGPGGTWWANPGDLVYID